MLIMQRVMKKLHVHTMRVTLIHSRVALICMPQSKCKGAECGARDTGHEKGPTAIAMNTRTPSRLRPL